MYTNKDNEFIAWYPNRLFPDSSDRPWQKREAAYYVHIPFCTSICDYCGFSIERVKGADQNDYFAALKTEISHYRDRLANYEFVCGHFGGGTPSAIPSSLIAEIKTLIDSTLNLSLAPEVTIEVNPISVDSEKLSTYSQLGINRLSIGVQSFNNRLLKIIGRPHRSEDVTRTFELVKAHGWENYSVDLMYGIPGQTFTELTEDLRRVLAATPKHISCFRLEIIPFTALKLREGAGLLPPRLSQDTLNEMDDLIREYLCEAGYVHYGAFNFAKPGFESVHNRIAFVAPQKEYVGFGNSAYSFINGSIYCNHADVGTYKQSILEHNNPIALSVQVSQRELMSRFFVLGLKFFRVSGAAFGETFGVPPQLVFGDVLMKLADSGMLTCDGEDYVLTKRGRLYVNNVCKEFFTEANRGSSQYMQFVPTLTRKQVEHFASAAKKVARQV